MTLPTIEIISPASPACPNILTSNTAPFIRSFTPLELDHLTTPKSPEQKAKSVTDGLCAKKTQIILCSRGGYGTSEILDHIDWPRLTKVPEKALVGFSDISALHAAIISRLGWSTCIHGPMPASEYWQKEDLEAIRKCISSEHFLCLEESATSSANQQQRYHGRCFGGCLSVLTNLLGTRYFPNPTGYFLFLEDIGESIERIKRYLTQWIQTGILPKYNAIILGSFKYQGENHQQALAKWLIRRIKMPVFTSPFIGHQEHNHPIRLNLPAVIEGWQGRFRLRIGTDNDSRSSN